MCLPISDADADPGSGDFFTPGSGIRDGKNPDPWYGIRNKHPRSQLYELQLFGLNTGIFQFSVANPDPGFGIQCRFDLGFGMEKLGSGIKIPDLQHCFVTFMNCYL